jgi:multisubunit Na+/H+ antiporter MnhB subunit
MSSRRFKRERDNKVIAICAVSIVLLGLGYFMVENLSKREKPPLGMTFNVIVGFLLMSIGVIVLAITLKNYFFPKKKKKKSRPVFLDETMNKKDKEK